MTQHPNHAEVEAFMKRVEASNPHEKEFLQAVREVVETVMPIVVATPRYQHDKILERIVEPERTIIFRVPWVDDAGNVQVNRGFRVQFNSAIGPYKGGLRFHPSVNLSILKFLGFEQIFKNALTTLPMGGGKGGSDFDPKGKSDREVMRFCQAFMTELQRHIGANTDVPAGDIGVGGREIGFLFGQYKRLRDEFTGVLTGKGMTWGGSLVRPEATGFGAVYFAVEMLKRINETFEGKTVVISGSGNVAQHAAEKALEFGAKVVSMSDSSGYIYDSEGFDLKVKLPFIMDLKNVKRGRISEYVTKFPNAKFVAGEAPWKNIPGAQIVLPCATQNELHEDDAVALIKGGSLLCVAEGANMPCLPGAIEAFQKAKVLYAPGKASNAGGVATSGLEMSQNSLRINWDSEEVNKRLHDIMVKIHAACVEHGKNDDGSIDYVRGANIAGFIKVADAMCEQGIV